ncbi:hypothetical protein E8M24_29095 [Bacillus thuringiensis]|nr:hypothetical protein E8M24_29095 [Bacillus thuringiensis]
MKKITILGGQVSLRSRNCDCFLYLKYQNKKDKIREYDLIFSTRSKQKDNHSRKFFYFQNVRVFLDYFYK